MDYLKEINVQKVWTQFTSSIPNFTSFSNVFDGVIHSDDWQIRLSFMLFICTLVNIVLIGLAWKIFGDSITNMFHNKPKSPARTLDNLYRNNESLTQSMEELIAKKIQ